MSATVEDRRDVAAIHPVRFWVKYQPEIQMRSGRPIETGEMVAHDWVEWVKKGDAQRSTTQEKVVRVQRDPIMWDAIRPHYDAWKRGQDVVLTGTPLDALPFMEAEVIKVLASVHIRTAEDLANAEDSAVSKLNVPGMRALRGKAKAFLDAKATVSGVSGELAALRDMVERMQAEAVEKDRTIEQLASESGRRRRTRDEVMTAPQEG